MELGGRLSRRIPLLLTVAALVLGSGLSAQDVETLGRVYGTTPPQAYFDELQADPEAFSSSTGSAHGSAVQPLRGGRAVRPPYSGRGRVLSLVRSASR